MNLPSSKHLNGNIDMKTLRFSRQIFPVKNYYNNVVPY